MPGDTIVVLGHLIQRRVPFLREALTGIPVAPMSHFDRDRKVVSYSTPKGPITTSEWVEVPKYRVPLSEQWKNGFVALALWWRSSRARILLLDMVSFGLDTLSFNLDRRTSDGIRKAPCHEREGRD